MAIEKLKR